MRTQQAIQELLTIEPMGVNDLASKTATSAGYIRTQLKAMEAAGIVERVDGRMPFIYRVNPNNTAVRYEKEIANAKARLFAPPLAEDNFVAAAIKKAPKADWEKITVLLEVYANAIKELNNEGKLVDTL